MNKQNSENIGLVYPGNERTFLLVRTFALLFYLGLTMGKIPLSQGKFAIVDDEDFGWLSKWKWAVVVCNRHQEGYAKRQTTRREMPRRQIAMHREVLGLKKDDKMQCDHINGNTLDNRRCNLRICTHAENMRNRRMQQNNTSGYRGVVYAKAMKRIKRWRTVIRTDFGRKTIGIYKTVKEAAIAYDKAALIYHGEFARTNFSRENYETQNS